LACGIAGLVALAAFPVAVGGTTSGDRLELCLPFLPASDPAALELVAISVGGNPQTGGHECVHRRLIPAAPEQAGDDPGGNEPAGLLRAGVGQGPDEPQLGLGIGQA